MIWGEVGHKPQTVRFETLSAELALCGLEQTFASWPLGEEPIETVWRDIEAKGFAQIRVGRDEGMRVQHLTAEIPSDVNLLQCADALTNENGKWVARNFFYHAIVEIMVQEVKALDFTGGVLIVGADCEARVLAHALSQVGFRRMTIAGVDDQEVDALITDLRRRCFGVEFVSTKTSLVTQMAATQSVAVNTLATDGQNPLITELSYFNFLKAGGVWMETSSDSVSSPLVQEARDLNLQTVTSLDVMSHVDALWAKACFGISIDRARYLAACQKKLTLTSQKTT